MICRFLNQRNNTSFFVIPDVQPGRVIRITTRILTRLYLSLQNSIFNDSKGVFCLFQFLTYLSHQINQIFEKKKKQFYDFYKLTAIYTYNLNSHHDKQKCEFKIHIFSKSFENFNLNLLKSKHENDLNIKLFDNSLTMKNNQIYCRI